MSSRDKTCFKFFHYQRSTQIIKLRLDTLKRYVCDLIETNIPPTSEQSSTLQRYSKEAAIKRIEYEKHLQKCLDLLTSEEAPMETLSTDQDKICDLSVEIISKIETLIQPTEPSASPVSARSVHVTHEQPAPFVRLPKLELKHFSGEPLEWISFFNLFNSSIHRNATLPAVTKFQYLLSVLSGEALNLIKSLPLSTANYTVAYDLLKERYHSPRRLITLHLNQILDLTSVNHSAKQMRKFLNSYNENIQALKGLDTDITVQNPLLSAMVLRKMDNDLRKRFEHSRSSGQSSDEDEPSSVMPDITEIIKFLNQECTEIEDAYSTYNYKPISLNTSHTSSATHSSVPHNKYFKPKKMSYESKVSLMTSNSVENTANRHKLPQCFVCSQNDHKVYSCPVFKSKDAKTRFQMVKENKRCTSCLGNHNLIDCKSKSTCFTCHKNHHSMLHFENKVNPQSLQETGQTSRQDTSTSRQESSTYLTCQEKVQPSYSQTTVLLGTLLVKLTAPNGVSHVFRALADSGSQSCFLTENAAQLLCAPRSKTNHSVIGLSQIPTRSKGITNLSVQTLSGKVIAPKHPFLILDKICVDLPRITIAPEVLTKVRPYVLADPTFHMPGSIDILLGGSLFPHILTQVAHSLGPGLPSVIGTHFGFIVMGDAPCAPQSDCYINSQMSTTLLTVNDMDLHNSLQKFWLQEEPPVCSKRSEEDELCDQHFLSTHFRDNFGRYCVRLPFKKKHPPLGHSLTAAEKRLQSLERKFSAQPQFKQLYSEFMADYLSSGHMELAQNIDLNADHYVLPHHGVIKESSSTTRLRTVFDASSKTSTDISLNQILLTGKKMQTNICDLILTFRSYNVVFSCDIRQMYRQIKVHSDDQKYQLILWRENTDQAISLFKLTTVTYGINCSPYLAIRTLHQLAADEGASFPEAAEILRTQTFVDDIISGGDSEEAALQLQKQLISLLGRGGFELRKWTSNSSRLLQDLPDGHLETPVFLQDTSEPQFNILGLHWSPTTDSFTYNINWPVINPTKRQVLGLIAQIYDPCGYLSPFIMLTKCFMQLLWSHGLPWDAPLPHNLAIKWQTIVSDTKALSNINIPRALHLSSGQNIELHGFSDASESGFAASVYLKAQLPSNEVTIRLILSKTRVAPLKRVTLPRLELCGAHLLVQLMSYCLAIYNLTLNQCHLWCDSSIVLTWLRTPSYRLKTYVANRVSQCQELIPSHCWRHISSADNPADCASRGVLPSQLVEHPLWWSGPEWLKLPFLDWPTRLFNPVDLSSSDETKATPLTVLTATDKEDWSLLYQYSTWPRLLYVMAYTLRFIYNCRNSDKRTGPLTTLELNSSKIQIFKQVQKTTFSDDFKSLNQKENPVCSSRLKRLSPFLDDQGLICVGGRLAHAPLSQRAQHPVILPKRHHVVNLLINYYHITHLHAGPQLTQSLLSQTVWILSARSAIRAQIYKCIKCFKLRPRNSSPLMGDLPVSRVTPARAFVSTGVDYAGPFNIKILNLRAIRHVKVYMCVFICMVTKAVHLEVVTDLTADSFIATLTRFVSRRGLCSDVYSDCGTNFIGANTILKKLIKETIYSPQSQDKILQFTSMKGINFHFNPPAAPHQGGLWEAAVKSAKYHLRRVMGDTILTLMEFTTLICQVEAMLNSRPLSPLSEDPSELTALTPGHFLIGCSLASVPDRDHSQVSNNRLKQWHLVQALQQRIWKRWMKEYLHTLQQRSKWCKSTKNLEVDDLVLIHCDTPPLTWPMARIVAVHPGSDGIVRCVDLKTKNGFFTRPSVKVFKLPIHE